MANKLRFNAWAGGYKADRTTPVHHKNEHFPATKMVYQTFDRLTQLSVPLMPSRSGSGTRNMEKSNAMNSGHQAVQAGAPDAASGVQFPALLKFKAGFRPATLERIKLRRIPAWCCSKQYCRYRHRK